MTLHFRLLEAGCTWHPEISIYQGGSWKSCRFPASVVYIEHPRHGRILFDTGYSARFHEATAHFPEKLYALVTPVNLRPEETAVYQLSRLGIAAESIDYVIISHFHADHVAGLADFPRARYLFIDSAYREVMSYSRFQAVRKGFLKSLLPADFERRAQALLPSQAKAVVSCLGHFPQFDLFQDGSLIGVALPGHAPGHMGLWLNQSPRPLFFVADACWLMRQIQENRAPTRLASLVMEDPGQYRSTIADLHRLYTKHPELQIVPCHCETSLQPFKPSDSIGPTPNSIVPGHR